MSNFNEAIGWVLPHEVNPYSPDNVTPEPNGGWAKYGFNTVAHPELVAKYGPKFGTMTMDDAKKEYFHIYWNPLYDQINVQRVANKVLDMAVNMGIREAALLIQRTINSLQSIQIPVDGRFGCTTLQVINMIDYDRMLVGLRKQMAKFYEGLYTAHPDKYAKVIATWRWRAAQ